MFLFVVLCCAALCCAVLCCCCCYAASKKILPCQRQFYCPSPSQRPLAPCLFFSTLPAPSDRKAPPTTERSLRPCRRRLYPSCHHPWHHRLHLGPCRTRGHLSHPCGPCAHSGPSSARRTRHGTRSNRERARRMQAAAPQASNKPLIYEIKVLPPSLVSSLPPFFGSLFLISISVFSQRKFLCFPTQNSNPNFFFSVKGW